MKKSIIPNFCLLLFAFFILSPFLYSLIFFSENEAFLKNTLLVLRYSKTFHTGFWNSLIYSVTITTGQLVISLLAAYAFSCFKFRGRDILFAIVIIVMMMPHQVTVVPSYILLQNLNMIDTRGAIILPQLFAPFCVFLLRQNMIHTDISILEAAEIDGANSIKKLIYIVLPVNKGGIYALLLLKLSENWCLYEAPVSFTTNKDIQPLSVLIAFLSSSLSVFNIMIVGLLMCIPVIIIYFLFSDSLVKGLGRSTLK